MAVKAFGLVILFCLTVIISVIAQQQDTLLVKPDWGPFVFGPRIGLGIQKTIFTEAGLSYHRAGGHFKDGPKGQCLYSSLEWIPKVLPNSDINIYSLKLGFEQTTPLLSFALEGRYATNFNNGNKVYMTPKFGLGIWAMINAMYGYNIGLSKGQFQEIGNHQFSIAVNLNTRAIRGL